MTLVLRCSLLALFLFCAFHAAKAQQEVPWETLLEQMAEDEDYENNLLEDYYEELNELHNNPININTATESDLEKLPFHTGKQREDISRYLYRYGGMATLGELAMIPSIDARLQSLLRCFLYVGEKTEKDTLSLKTILKHGRHDATASLKVPLYNRKGDKNGYLGYKYKHWMRYDFSSHDRLRLGFVASHDAGEPFLSSGNSYGYDYYSLYLQVKKMGIVDNIVVGRYRLSAGKGLVINTGMSYGKMSLLAGLNRKQTDIKPHSSRSAASYLQGAAATISLSSNLKATAYASYRPLDATLNDDGTAATIVESGYHRTPTEMNKKNNTYATDAGANIRYATKKMHIGASLAYTHLDRELCPNTKSLFRKYYNSGSTFVNAGLEYGYWLGRALLSGETAIDKQGDIATINMLTMNMTGSLSLTAVQRYYSYKYNSLRANSFADGGSTQNENGVYIGANWKPMRGLSLTAYSDYAYFEWPKYMISQSSWSWDNMIGGSYTWGDWTLGARYRLKIRQKDNEEKTALITKTEHRTHVAIGFKSASGWESTTRADMSLASINGKSAGYMISQAVGYGNERFAVSAKIRYFNTDDYNSRIYSYEGGLFHTFGSAMCYGHGIRYSLNAKAMITKQLTLVCRLSTANRFDVSTTGSGLQMVDASSLTDIDMQLRWKL